MGNRLRAGTAVTPGALGLAADSKVEFTANTGNCFPPPVPPALTHRLITGTKRQQPNEEPPVYAFGAVSSTSSGLRAQLLPDESGTGLFCGGGQPTTRPG